MAKYIIVTGGVVSSLGKGITSASVGCLMKSFGLRMNNRYRRALENNGMVISGEYVEKRLAEIIELPDHPWFVGVQYHPEFKSHPNKPHPLFRDFVKAALKNGESR